MAAYGAANGRELQLLEPSTLMEVLWPEGLPAQSCLTLWTPASKRAYHFATLESGAKAWPRIESALVQAAACDDEGKPASLYVGMAVRRTGLGRYKRGGKRDVVAVSCLYADVDYRGGQHAAEDLPTREEALAMLRGLPVPPSIILDSGGGFYAIWLFREPWMLSTEQDVLAYETLLGNWQGVLRARFEGKHLDDTAKADQLLRPVGALNRKYDKRVTAVEWNPSLRYNPCDFEEWLFLESWPFLGVGGEIASRVASTYSGPLPEHAPEHILFAANTLGIRQVKDNALVLRACPSCGEVGTTAKVSPVSGRISCYRNQACDLGRGGPRELGDWTREFLKPPDLAEFERLARSEAEPVVVEDANWPEIGLEDVGEAVVGLIEAACTETASVRALGSEQAIPVYLHALPPGAGKTHTLVDIAVAVHILRTSHSAHAGPPPPPLAILFPTHALAGAFIEMVEEAAREWGVECPPICYRKGVEKGGCNLWHAIPNSEAAGIVKRSLCHHECEFVGKCDATRAPRKDELLVSVQAAYESLATDEAGMLGDRILVLDEVPEELAECTVTLTDCERVAENREHYGYAHVHRDGEWRRVRHGLRRQMALLFGRGAQQLHDAAKVELRRADKPHGISWSGEPLRDLICSHAGSNFLDAVSILAGIPPGDLPRLEMDRVLSGDYRGPEDVPHKIELESLWAVLDAAMMKDPEERAAAERRVGFVHLVADARGIRFEIRRCNAFGVGGEAATIVLSATARLHADTLRAASPHLAWHVGGHRVRSRQGGRLVRVYCNAPRATRRGLLDGPGLRMSSPGATVVEGVLGTALRERAFPFLERELGEAWGHGGEVALIAPKAVREALAEQEDLRRRTEGKTGATLSPFGHWGLDEIGSNAFENSDALVLLSGLRSNRGALERDAQALGMDSGTLSRLRDAEGIVQAEGRLRGLGRGMTVVVIAVMPEVPACWVGTDYMVPPPSVRSSAAKKKQGARLRDALVAQAREDSLPLAAPVVRMRLEGAMVGVMETAHRLLKEQLVDGERIPESTLRRAVREAATILGWRRHEVPGMRGTWAVWAPPDWAPMQVADWATRARQGQIDGNVGREEGGASEA